MKKILKRIASLLLVFTFCFTSMAAIVSDNDGSAFITKAEFDSLKNDFQAQINNYNTSIDAKIDGAIAAYLAGISITSAETKTILYSDWKSGVTCLNYKPSVTYQLPNLNLDFNNNTAAQNVIGSQTWLETGFFYITIKYDRPDSQKQVVYMCDAGIDTNGVETTSTNNDPVNVQWLGRSIDYKDKITASQTYRDGTYLHDLNNGNVSFNYWANFVPGLYTNLSTSCRTIWAPNLIYTNYSNSSYSKKNFISGNPASMSLITAVELETNSNGDVCDYEHIVTWGSAFTGMRLVDKNWLKHCLANPEKNVSSYPTSNGSNGLSISGANSYMFHRSANTGTNDGGRSQSSSITYASKGDNSSTISNGMLLPGLLSKTYSAKNLYQAPKKIKAEVGKSTIESENIPVLQDGFPLLAAKKGATIKWVPVFKNSKKGGSISTDDIWLRLSVGRFGEKGDKMEGEYVKDYDETEGVYNDYFIIKNLSNKIEFQMPIDGIVYAKWRHKTEYSGNWEITLDIDKCNTYVYENN